MYELLHLLDGTLPDGSRVDLTIADGRIRCVAQAKEPSERGSLAVASAGFEDAVRTGAVSRETTIDLGGRLVLPALVNGHAHLDKTFVGSGWQPHRPGTTVGERVTAERAIRDELDVPVAERADALAAAMIGFGTGTVRTHVDIDPAVGLASLEAILDLQDRLRDTLRVQVVAFPQSGIIASPGVGALLEEALRAGADAIGGLDPLGFDQDAEGHLDTVFDLAARYDVGVDIHLHDLGEPARRQYAMIAERTRRHGRAGRVAVSHAYGLGSIGVDQARRVGAEFAATGIAVMTNGPAGPMPPVLAMRAEGATVFSGSDNIRDAWWPYGDGDMLAVARQVAYQSNFRTDEELGVALDLVTASAARALGVHDYGVHEGAVADLLVIDSPSPAAAVAAHPASRLVLHGGRIVAAQLASAHVLAPITLDAMATRP
ncbi:cytosine deaminase [Microbacterium sp. BE35]|uniref:amidohydrolase n=1 Tax=Microbacterium sp. BE35 TaxID=2817773 RepID=UPI0028566FB5|nr:amidohydrolase [Microbacterium sp. BE35]MDR7191078.1 cytosine deaminase [Microbacterium sp. BE35]